MFFCETKCSDILQTPVIFVTWLLLVIATYIDYTRHTHIGYTYVEILFLKFERIKSKVKM